jgi:Fur family transcriptional regulator, zinc uptake regulator
VTELDDHELAHALEDAAKRLGFTVGKATIEAEGRCANCARI